MAKHDARGRSVTTTSKYGDTNKHVPAKTEPKVAEKTDLGALHADKKDDTDKVTPIRGSAMRARWSACLKARPGVKTVMPADVKAFPHDSIITALVDGNPKTRGSAPCYDKYGFRGKKGATTTIGAYIKAMEHNGGATACYGHIAWDVNHQFIEVRQIVEAATPQEAEEKVVEAEENTELSHIEEQQAQAAELSEEKDAEAA